jgi:fructosamine-3-kinase
VTELRVPDATLSHLAETVLAVTGQRVIATRPLHGGSVARVLRLELGNGSVLAAKVSDSAEGGLAVEARMLRYLAAHTTLPVPQVRYADDGLLVMDFVDAAGGLDARAEGHAAELLAALHGLTASAFGFEWDTLVGGLPQPNPWTEDWCAFFRDRRLLYMGRQALDAGHLPAQSFAALERLSGKLDRYLDAGVPPSLIHGDVWGGNVLARDGRIAAFLDPAIYFADAEIELAFSTLFGTFGEAFFDRYQEIRPLRPGFFQVRRDLYNLYPLLVHTRLFGGGYAASVQRTLARFV